MLRPTSRRAWPLAFENKKRTIGSASQGGNCETEGCCGTGQTRCLDAQAGRGVLIQSGTAAPAIDRRQQDPGFPPRPHVGWFERTITPPSCAIASKDPLDAEIFRARFEPK